MSRHAPEEHRHEPESHHHGKKHEGTTGGVEFNPHASKMTGGHDSHGHKPHPRTGRSTGGRDMAEEDLRENPREYNHGKPEEEAEAMHARKGGRVKLHSHAKHGEHHGMTHEGVKHHHECRCHKCMGGRSKHAHGGAIHHHREGHGPEHEPATHRRNRHHRATGGHVPEHAHSEKSVEGEHVTARQDRVPRKAGGRTTSDTNPFTTAARGHPAPGRKVMSGPASGETV